VKPVLLWLVILVLVMSDSGLSSSQADWAVRDFNERVNRYVDLHHAVAASLGPEVIWSDPAKLLEQKQYFAVAMRAARPDAVGGEVFTPEIASFLRSRITAAIRETGFDLAAALREDQAECEDEPSCELPVLEVNDRFPWHAGPVMWPSLLWRLPPLPPEIEYRFFAGDLVLIDVRGGLVVDILRAALPTPDAVTPDVGSPCDVHPDLPACWS
jgi:hypothetical protein